MKRLFIFSLTILATITSIHAQEKSVWNGKKCAVSLTYDDGLNVDLDNAIPVLDSMKFKGTFYVSGFSPGFKDRLTGWKKASAKGHEISNHTIYHPCTGKIAGREWVNPDYDLSNYSVKKICDEILMTNVLLRTLDGKTRRTFAYPCGDTKIGDSLYFDQVKPDFVAARGVTPVIEQIKTVDIYNIGSFMINGQTGEDLIKLVKQAMKEKGLLVFLFHGVGGEHNLNVSLKAHSELLHFLKQNEKDIWIAPIADISERIRTHQNTSSTKQN